MAGNLAVNAGPRAEIRQDLNLYPAGVNESGQPVWHLHDPLANRFFQLHERDVELLALIGQKDAREIAAAANRLKLQDATGEEVEQLLTFLRHNNLVRGDALQQGLYEEMLSRARQRNWWQMALRNPLFFRIPVWKPDAFLAATLPYVSWLVAKPTLVTLALLGVLGLYMAVHQIDRFFSTFLHFFSLSGLAIYLLVLVAVKIFHELGHAYAAKMTGLRVPVIGVAFMVGWPILYTDASDAWKVPSKRQRLRIGVAGVGVELGIAALSLFLWSITPDGSLRSVFFLLATTTWVLSIFVNFNPLMRFDGYYLLSDLADLPNLESRSFAMARWWLREKLFGLNHDPEERVRMAMVCFAFAVWTYRFLLFLGIALLVYGFFFKALGIVMFVVEIVYFIVRPVYNEVREWWSFRREITWNPATRRTVILLGVFGLLFFAPWYGDVSAQAVLKARSNDLYLPAPGRLVRLPAAGEVRQGDLLFAFESPELDLEIEDARNRYEELSWIRSALGFDGELRNEALIVESELRTQNQRLRSLVDRQSRLRVEAPFDGTLVDIAPDALLRDWLPAGTRLGTVIDSRDARVIAWLPEEQLARVAEGMTARFVPESLEYGVHDLIVDNIEFMGTPELDNLYVASTFGGDVAVRETDAGELLTVHSQYKVELVAAQGELATEQVVRGTVVIDGHARSLFAMIYRRFVAVFIRETGF